MEQPDWTLLTRYVDGTCTQAERQTVKQWIELSSKNREIVAGIERIWKLSALPRANTPRPETYVGSDWHKLQAQLELDAREPEQAERSRPRRDEQRRIDRTAERGGTAGRSRPSKYYALRITAVLLVFLGGAALVSSLFDNDARTAGTVVRVASTEAGERGYLTLSDGSRVHLNVRSKIEYPRFFDGPVREVRLSGEAFFEVTSDPSRPFIVHANGSTIRVRGTSFGIRAYSAEDAVKVVVVEGAVDLSTEEVKGERQSLASLAKNDLGAIVSGRLQAVQSNVDTSLHLGWKHGMLIFEDAPFNSVAVELENWYDLNVQIQDSALASRRVSASFDDAMPDLVLEVLATTLQARYERDGPDVTFYSTSE